MTQRKRSSAAALIAARSGSKGIPRKNLADVGGKPLLAHSIEAARAAERIDRVFVSTDSEEIAEVARAFGAEVPFLRPRRWAGDRVSPFFAWVDFLSRLKRTEGHVPAIKVFLPPTSPFRAPRDIDAAVELMDSGCESVGSYARMDGATHYFLAGEHPTSPCLPIRFFSQDGRPMRVLYAPSGYLSAVGHFPTFDPDGLSEAEISRRADLYHVLARRNRGRPARIAYLILDWIKAVDIDEPEDLALARHLCGADRTRKALKTCATRLLSFPF